MSCADRLITLSTSAVAVCCSSAASVSLNRRAFSMAMTAWSAKRSTSVICSSENGRGAVRHIAITPIARPLLMSGT